MKKIIALAIALIALAIPMQTLAEIRWGTTVGFDHTNLKFKQNLVTVKSVPGFQAGVNGELMFPGVGFGLDLGMMYTMRGAKVNLGEKLIWSSEGYGNPRVFMHDIDIPVNLKFKWTRMQGLEDFIAPYIFGGPVVTIQVAHGDCKAFQYTSGELGLQAGFGIEILKHWQVQASYIWGMTYSLKTRLLDDFSARSRTVSIRATYYF